MNTRRNFLQQLISGTVAFTILPSATTYCRFKWKKGSDLLWLPNLDYVKANYSCSFLVEEKSYHSICIGSPPKNLKGSDIRRIIESLKTNLWPSILDKDGKFLPNLGETKR